MDSEPTLQSFAMMEEGCEKVLSLLDDNSWQIALLRLEGYTNDEIALRMGLSPRTIERKLQLIRQTWSDLL